MAYTNPDTFAAGWNDACDRKRAAGFTHDYHTGYVAAFVGIPGNTPAPKGSRYNENSAVRWRDLRLAEAAA